MYRSRSLPPHLERRRSGYLWRRRWPRPPAGPVPGADRAARDSAGAEAPSGDGARPRGGWSPFPDRFLCFSLRTHVLRDAKILARRLDALSDEVFAAQTEGDMAIAPDTADRILTELARFQIAAFERARALADPRSPEAAELELRREHALQETLRRALYLGDREAARAPLRDIAARLGLDLDEADPDWTALAHEATRVLLDVAQERARRMQGHYAAPSAAFRRAMAAEAGPVQPDPRSNAPGSAPAPVAPAPVCDVPPAAFASDISKPPPAAAVGTSAGSGPAGVAPATPGAATNEPAAAPPTPVPPTPAPPAPEAAPAAPDQPGSGAGAAPGPESRSVAPTGAEHATAPPPPAIVPAGLRAPDDMTPEEAQAARIAARPPRITVDRRKLSEASRAALDKPRGITLPEALVLYRELKCLGYANEFATEQQPTAEAGAGWLRNNREKPDVAERFWPELLGDGPLEEISALAVGDALETLWRVPRDHGRSRALHTRDGFLDLVERADAMEAEARAAAAADAAPHRTMTPAEREEAARAARIPRLSPGTYIKHARYLAAVSSMLADMQLIDDDPFTRCRFTRKQESALRAAAGTKLRTAWDDRFDLLLATPVFRGETKEPGDPLFWAPLIARLMGLRAEECLQLRPEDFGSEGSIPYVRVRNAEGNHVKSEWSERRLPVHPQLVELGLPELVALRERQSQPRLFPYLERGQARGTFSAIFTKTFGYYRKTNGVYWEGLDFHALRTTFHDDLINDDGSDAVRRYLMGHAPVDEGERSYTSKLRPEKLLARISGIRIDISKIHSPFREAPPSATDKARALGLRIV